MSQHDRTLKMVVNLDRGGIEKRLAEVRKAAQTAGLSDLVQMLDGSEGAPRAQIEQKVKSALKWLGDKPDHQYITGLLELVELNLPNLK